MIMKNFIKKLPKGENAAVDESLLWLQVRVRKGTEWEKPLKRWLLVMKGELDPDECFEDLSELGEKGE